MITVDDILGEKFEDNAPKLENRLQELENVGFGSKQDMTTIECTSRKDDDFEFAQLEGCTRTLPLTDIESDTDEITCPCGRNIELEKKEKTTKFRFEADYDGVRDWLQAQVKDVCSEPSVQTKSLTYLGYRFEGQILRTKIGEYHEDELIDTTVDIHLCHSKLSTPVAETIKLYGKNSFFVLVGDGVGNVQLFENLGLPYVEFDNVYTMNKNSRSEAIWNLIDDARAINKLTDIEKRAKIAAKLYRNYRTETNRVASIDEDVFEYITNTLFNYCFETSELYGTSESGLELPDGTLTLQLDQAAQVYLWDAKYSKPSKEPYNLDASDQRNMTKYPRKVYENAGMAEDDFPLDEFAGFIFVTPRMNANKISGFATKLHDEYQGQSFMSGAPVIQIRANALIALYERIRGNSQGTRQVPKTTLQEFHRLLQADTHHNSETEFAEYHEKHPDKDLGPEETTIFDVTETDIDNIFEELISEKSSSQTEIDHEYLRKISRKMQPN